MDSDSSRPGSEPIMRPVEELEQEAMLSDEERFAPRADAEVVGEEGVRSRNDADVPVLLPAHQLGTNAPVAVNPDTDRLDPEVLVDSDPDGDLDA